MENSWKTMKLGTVTKWSSGGTPKKSEASYWDGEIPWISASSMDGHLYSDSKLKITDSGLASGSRLAPKNSILLLVRGSILHQKMQVGLTTREVAFNQDVKCLIADEQYLEPWYLLLWFKAKEQELLTIVESTGIGAGKFDTKLLSEYPIKIPPKDEREKIKYFGKALFDKSTNLIETNKTLEQMAQALFKSWFVDFDPVIDNALAAGNDIPDALQNKAEQRLQAQQLPDFKPLPDNIRALFPKEFEQTEEPNIGIAGWIPNGWKKDNLKSFGKVVTGKTPPKKVENAFDSAGIPFITPTDVDSDVYALNVARRLTEDGVKVVKNNVIEKGSVCVTCIGSQMGKTVITATKAVTNQQLNSIILSDQFSRNYIFMNLRTRREELFNLGSSGSTMPILNKSSFESLSVIRPSDDILKSFSKFTENQIEKILVNSKQNKQLENIRDSLLPKLISGEIKLPSKDVA